jgi:hypothetical protein
MNDRSFLRQVAYLALMALLLLPLALLSQPATVATSSRPASPGGYLAQQRDAFKLGQANLGKIDPTSETMKLATLGMRGVAASILWWKADEYKMKEDWTSLGATLDQIANLQPNYIGVWRFQGWNLSYNISAEWDDYRDRYYWVTKGIEYLQKGITYNANEPRLLCEVGTFAAHKIGRSDEHLQFRRLFREDDVFHEHQKVLERDNWLFGEAYYREAERVVDDLGAMPPPVAPVIFRSYAPMTRIYDATALDDDSAQALNAAASRPVVDKPPREAAAETERRLQDVEKRYRLLILAAWETAASHWKRFGDREFLGVHGEPLRINDREATERRLHALTVQLNELCPGQAVAIRQEKIERLPPEARDALKTPREARSKKQAELAEQAESLIEVSFHELAERAPADRRTEARELADKCQLVQDAFDDMRIDADNVNYDFWRLRCEMERSDDARKARRLLHRATTAYTIDSDLVTARRDFEEGFARWLAVLQRYPALRMDESDYSLLDALVVYQQVLRQLDQPLPADFPLPGLLELQKKLM